MLKLEGLNKYKYTNPGGIKELVEKALGVRHGLTRCPSRSFKRGIKWGGFKISTNPIGKGTSGNPLRLNGRGRLS